MLLLKPCWHGRGALLVHLLVITTCRLVMCIHSALRQEGLAALSTTGNVHRMPPACHGCCLSARCRCHYCHSCLACGLPHLCQAVKQSRLASLQNGMTWVNLHVPGEHVHKQGPLPGAHYLQARHHATLS